MKFLLKLFRRKKSFKYVFSYCVPGNPTNTFTVVAPYDLSRDDLRAIREELQSINADYVDLMPTQTKEYFRKVLTTKVDPLRREELVTKYNVTNDFGIRDTYVPDFIIDPSKRVNEGEPYDDSQDDKFP